MCGGPRSAWCMCADPGVGGIGHATEVVATSTSAEHMPDPGREDLVPLEELIRQTPGAHPITSIEERRRLGLVPQPAFPEAGRPTSPSSPAAAPSQPPGGGQPNVDLIAHAALAYASPAADEQDLARGIPARYPAGLTVSAGGQTSSAEGRPFRRAAHMRGPNTRPAETTRNGRSVRAAQEACRNAARSESAIRPHGRPGSTSLSVISPASVSRAPTRLRCARRPEREGTSREARGSG